MSLVELRQSSRTKAVSGGAMDRVVVRKRIDKRVAVLSVGDAESIAKIPGFLG